MPIYWTLKSVPEFEGMTRAERGRAWRKAYVKTLKHWPVWLALISCGALAALGAVLGRDSGLAIVGAGIGGGIGGMLFAQTAISVARTHYPHILRGNAQASNDESQSE